MLYLKTQRFRRLDIAKRVVEKHRFGRFNVQVFNNFLENFRSWLFEQSIESLLTEQHEEWKEDKAYLTEKEMERNAFCAGSSRKGLA